MHINLDMTTFNMHCKQLVIRCGIQWYIDANTCNLAA